MTEWKQHTSYGMFGVSDVWKLQWWKPTMTLTVFRSLGKWRVSTSGLVKIGPIELDAELLSLAKNEALGVIAGVIEELEERLLNAPRQE